MRNVRSGRRIDSSSIIAHPINSDLHTWERSLKCYIYMYIYMTLLIIDLDFLYQFNLGLIAPLLTILFHEMFEFFFLIFKSWQVCDRLAKWIIMLRFMALRWPRVFRRSNVGLVQHRDICVTSQWPVNKNWCKKTSKWNRIDIIFIIDSVVNFVQCNIHLCCHA